MNIKHVNIKQTKQVFALVIIAATLVSACGIAPEAVISPLATQAAALLAPVVAPTPTQPYTVQPGDTLSGIAVTFGTTVDNVITLNASAYPQMTDRRTLMAGWTLQVPMGAGVQSAAAAPSTSSGQAAAVDAAASEPTAVAVAPVRDASGGYFDYDAALEIIRLTNEERVKAGVSPLEMDETLMDIARKRAVEIVSDYSHAGLDDDCGECGENAYTFRSTYPAQYAVSGWMNSEGHRANILRDGFTKIGVGLYRVGIAWYAVQDFN